MFTIQHHPEKIEAVIRTHPFLSQFTCHRMLYILFLAGRGTYGHTIVCNFWEFVYSTKAHVVDLV